MDIIHQVHRQHIHHQARTINRQDQYQIIHRTARTIRQHHLLMVNKI